MLSAAAIRGIGGLKSGRRLVAVIVGLGIGLSAAAQPARAEAWRLTGRGGDAEWGETPVVVELKRSIPPGPYVLETGVIVQQGSGRELLASEDVQKAYLGM